MKPNILNPIIVKGFVSSFPFRGVTPAGQPSWLQDETQSAEAWEKYLADWKEAVQGFRDLTTKHVFDKPEKDLVWNDLRQHRAGLLNYLSYGDLLILELLQKYVEHFGEKDAVTFIQEIESIQDSLLTELFEWHAPLHSELPASLIQGFKDIDEGKTVDLDKAMTDAP